MNSPESLNSTFSQAGYSANMELLEYRIGQLEKQVAEANCKLTKLLLQIETSKTAGRWLIGIAAAMGAFVTWLIHTFGHILWGGKA